MTGKIGKKYYGLLLLINFICPHFGTLCIFSDVSYDYFLVSVKADLHDTTLAYDCRMR